MKIRGDEYHRGGTLADSEELAGAVSHHAVERQNKETRRRNRFTKYQKRYGPLFWKWPHRAILWQAPCAPEINGLKVALKRADIKAKGIRGDFGLPACLKNPDYWQVLRDEKHQPTFVDDDPPFGGEHSGITQAKRAQRTAWAHMRLLGDAIEGDNPSSWAKDFLAVEKRGVDLDKLAGAIGRAKSARIVEEARAQDGRRFIGMLDANLKAHGELATDLERFLQSPSGRDSEVRGQVADLLSAVGLLVSRKRDRRTLRKKPHGGQRKEAPWRPTFVSECAALGVGAVLQKRLIKLAGLETR
jgi:hypothetical protein